MPLYQVYADAVQRATHNLRGVLEFDTTFREPIPLEEVESAESIMTRFVTGDMGLGALSQELMDSGHRHEPNWGKSNRRGSEDFLRTTMIEDATEDGTSTTFPHLKGLEMATYPPQKSSRLLWSIRCDISAS